MFWEKTGKAKRSARSVGGRAENILLSGTVYHGLATQWQPYRSDGQEGEIGDEMAGLATFDHVDQLSRVLCMNVTNVIFDAHMDRAHGPPVI